ncbi:MAG: ATP-binding protein [Crocinitomicaceae bacterium]|nr:ATP-binding protein [Crocinitomicaceae bacterium]
MSSLNEIKLNGRITTNWNVITGGPCSGKTTVINILAKRGYKTTIEHARHYIDTQKELGNAVEAIRANKREFQMRVLEMQIEEESKLSTEDTVFLDRALPDAVAYYLFLGLDLDDELINAVNTFCYKNIFVLDPLPLIKDYARREDKKAQLKIHSLITEVYEMLPCKVTQVPVLPPEERVDFILESIQQ